MLTKSRIQALYESRKPAGFVTTMHHLLGLTDAQGNRHRDEHGRPCIKESKNPEERIRPEEVSIRALAEAIVGEAWAEGLHGAPQQLLEAGGVDVTQFANINAFTSTVAGLLEFQVLKGFETPEFVMSRLFTSRPTKLNGQRMGRVGGLGDKGATRKPGMPTKRVGLSEAWIDTPETVETALSCEVTKEAIFFDLTNEVLEQAKAVGQMIAYRKELRCIDVLIGVTQPYEYNDTGYDHYQTATPWINEHVNALADYTDIENSELLFSNMTDPATGIRILSLPKMIVSVPSLKYTLARILNSTEVRHGDGASASFQTVSKNPLPSYEVLTSPLIHQRQLAADGNNLSEANSKRWYHVCDGAFGYMENWPLTFAQAAPGQVDMIDRGIVGYFHANERGVPVVLEPRKVVENKVA